MKITIVIPEGNDFHEVHYHLMRELDFYHNNADSMIRCKDAATVTMETIPEENLLDGLQ